MEIRKYHITTENDLQEKFLTDQISVLNKPIATGLEKFIPKIRESISLVQNVADSLAGESKTKLNEAINLAKSASELISSKNNSHSADIEKITSSRTLKTSNFLQEHRWFELDAILRTIGINWNFDALLLQSSINDKTLQIVGYYCIYRYGIKDIFNIPQSICTSFFEALEERYNNNPFHNTAHASDVLHSFLYFTINSNLLKYFTSTDFLSLIIACLGHDVGHPGYTNRFLIDNKDELAIIYNDFSVLEMMHCSTIFQLLRQSKNNILRNLMPDDYNGVRKAIIEIIIATDISKHFEVLGQFRAKLINSPLDHDLLYFENKVNIMKIMIKCADIGYTAKQKDINERWSLLLAEEHFRQGDMQKLKNQPVSMYCDRENTDIAKSQASFLKNIALPLFEGFNQFLQSSDIGLNCVEQLKTNIKSWENIPKKKNKPQTVNKIKKFFCLW